MHIYTAPNPIHFLFITDGNGIHSAFPKIKEKLIEPHKHHISLVYHSYGNPILFSQELSVLSKWYPEQLIIYYLSEKGVGSGTDQETIEVLLNANTFKEIFICLFGNEDFVDASRKIVHFLDIGQNIKEENFLR